MEECSICYENLSKDTIKIEGCNHIFHSKCIHKWINNNEYPSCPLCRCQIVPRSMRSKKNIINNIISKEAAFIYNQFNNKIVLETTKNTKEMEEDTYNQDKEIFDRLARCLIKFPYILINNKLLKELIYEQSIKYNDNNMKKLCESVS